MKLVIIGATYPFRGGNAHYTSLLYLTLKKKHQVKLYSYKRQYPQFLYPGKTDKDPSKKILAIEEAEPILDYANPLTWYSTYKKIKKTNPDLLIFNWFTIFSFFQFFTISTLVKKNTKIKIVFICHNVFPHEPSFSDKFLIKLSLRNGDFFIVHSKNELENLSNLMPNANIQHCHHPIYDIFNFNNLTKKEAKIKLNIKGKTLLFFGLIRKYKGLEYLIQSLPLILKHFDIKLLIVGEFWENKKRYLDLICDLNLREKVKIIDQYIPNEDIEMYFRASDLIITPYVSVTGSGIIQIANSFNKPIIATKIGCFPEIIEDKKTGYLVKPKDPSSIAKAVLDYFDNPENAAMFKGNIIEKKKEFSWDKMAQTIERLIS